MARRLSARRSIAPALLLIVTAAWAVTPDTTASATDWVISAAMTTAAQSAIPAATASAADGAIRTATTTAAQGAAPGTTSRRVLTSVHRFPSPDARQGVAVDGHHVYALSDRGISRHDKRDGELVSRWEAGAAGVSRVADGMALGAVGEGVGRPGTDERIVHLNSGVVHAGRLFAAHSNWPRVPTRSSVEVWDAATLEHLASHGFGTRRGAFTWLDRHDGHWWGTFTDYGRDARDDPDAARREVSGTRLVRMDEGFRVLDTWAFPPALSARLAPMSNSGGSWGADGRLYLTGHDRPEAYVVERPEGTAPLRWSVTVALPGIEGQGIAWDRSAEAATLYGIDRAGRQVVRMRLP